MQRYFKMYRSHLAGVEAVETATGQSFARHSHDQYGIGVITAGAQRSFSGRGMVEAGPGDMITVNPGEVHDGIPIGAGRSWKILYFDPQCILKAVEDISEGRRVDWELADPVIKTSPLSGLFESCFAHLTGDTGDLAALNAESAFTILLGRLMQLQGDVRAAVSVPAAIARGRRRIDDDPMAAVSLADLAGECGLSRFQFLRAFRKATGLTPHAYLIQRRILAARGLIARGKTLADVAAACGFADQSHMTRLFARTYGVTPGVYALGLPG